MSDNSYIKNKYQLDFPSEAILNIGFDYSEEKDVACLHITKINSKGEVVLINTFYNDEAKEMYRKLTEKDYQKNEVKNN